MSRIPRLLALLAVLSLLFCLSACLSSDDDDQHDNTPTGPTFEPPTTADEAIAAFVEYYEAGDLDFYRELLDADFRFVDHEGVARDLAWELAVSQKIFGGLAGDDGIAIESIDVDRIVSRGVWQPVSTEDPHFGDVGEAMYRPYDVRFRFKIEGHNLYYLVTGLVIAYALEGDDGWSLRGFVDDTDGQKATESHSWTDVKSRFD